MSRSTRYRGLSARRVATVAAALLMLGGTLVGALAFGPPLGASATIPSAGTGLPLATLLASPRASVTDLYGGPSNPSPGASYSDSISVIVAFPYSNSASLNDFLAAVSDPSSPQYHHYLTAAEFDQQFAGNPSTYADAQTYFASFPGVNITSYADRSDLFLQGPATAISAAFGVHVEEFSAYGRGSYYAPVGTPTLPAPIAAGVSQVVGLSDYLELASDIASFGTLGGATPEAAQATSYPAPIDADGVQYVYGSDLQVAYDEQALFSVTYPTQEVVATILWAGCSVAESPCPDGDLTGGYNPNDVYTYFNQTIPAGEPHSTVYGVPFDGAPAPGVSANGDQSGAVLENTLDVDMVGSTAPGSTIYNVYGLSSSSAETDAAMSYILNPVDTPGLANVSVVSNSWGGADRSDASWSDSMQEAAARGITVLASSGDSGDSPLSPDWSGTNAEFPASVGFGTYGVIGVGGTTMLLSTAGGSNYLHILNQTAWYDTQAGDGSEVLGSSGGTSAVYAEPAWQLSSEANTYIEEYATAGERGTPDVSAIANNTIILLTGGLGIPESVYIAGTSVACPVTAGLLVEINAVLARDHVGTVGFVDPSIYTWANLSLQQPTSETQPIGAVLTGTWRSVLPTDPVYDVDSGANNIYPARWGYDLVTGWGSIDAYNLTTFLLNDSYPGQSFSLGGVQDELNLSGLAATSLGGDYNASVQQNFFVANSLGAPLYWVQNVIYINATPGGWAVNYTGWTVAPFFGLYSSETIYSYNFPLTGTTVTTPLTWTIASWLSGSGTNRTMNYQVNGFDLTLAMPGGQFIIGGYNYQYFWDGSEITNGPYATDPAPGGLAPQFGLVGGPTLGLGEFATPTAGTLVASYEVTGTNTFVPAAYGNVLGYTGDQTGETAANLNWSGSGAQWTLNVSEGSNDQGVLTYSVLNAGNPANESTTYPILFNESNLSPGSVWNVTILGLTVTCTVGTMTGNCPSNGQSLSISEPNGSFDFSVSGPSNYAANPSSGTVMVNGGATPVAIAFTRAPVNEFAVTFQESGLSGSFSWSVNVSGSGSMPSTSSTIVFHLMNNSYAYSVGNVSGYQVSPSSGNFMVVGSPQTFSITYTANGGGGNTSGFSLNNLCIASYCGYTLIYGLLGIVIICLAVAITGTVLSRRSERRERLAQSGAPEATPPPPAPPAPPPSEPPAPPGPPA